MPPLTRFIFRNRYTLRRVEINEYTETGARDKLTEIGYFQGDFDLVQPKTKETTVTTTIKSRDTIRKEITLYLRTSHVASQHERAVHILDTILDGQLRTPFDAVTKPDPLTEASAFLGKKVLIWNSGVIVGSGTVLQVTKKLLASTITLGIAPFAAIGKATEPVEYIYGDRFTFTEIDKPA